MTRVENAALAQAAGFEPAFRSWRIYLLEALLMAALSFGSYYVISRFLVQRVTVIGQSMVPTLQDSQTFLLNRWIFLCRCPKSSEVVVIRDPADNGYSVKRVVAGAGDSVVLKHGSVFVNGRKLQEPYLAPGTLTFGSSEQPDQAYHCGPGQFFVLGDNRSASIDSRSYGPVPKANVLGLVLR